MPKRYTLNLTMDSPLRGTHRVRASKGAYSQTGQSATLTYNSLDSRAGDEAALEDLYDSTQGTTDDGTGWNTSTGWASSGMSLSDSIYGVTTATIGGELRVTEIDLITNNLSGPLPEELQNLKQCTLLDVRENWLTGDLPDGLWGMTALEFLYLEGNSASTPNYSSGGYHPGKTISATNDFTGQLSSGLGNLTNLQEFWLERQGSMDGPIPSEIGNLSNLTFFSIFGAERDHVTGFTGEIPPEIGNCTSLVFLLISRNAIGGEIPPEMGNLVNLKALWCGGSNLTGNLPANLANMSSIRYFHHDRNGLSGVLPDFVFDGTWPDLNTFTHGWPENPDGSDGEGWTFDVGSIDWSNVPTLQHIGLAGASHYGTLNSTITQINPEIFGFGFASLTNSNSMSGELPQSGYENWTNVRYWRIDGHGLTGRIPTGFGSIEHLYFSNNNFSEFDSGGDFDLENKGDLTSINVDSNRLTPKDLVPGLTNFSGVTYNYDNQKPFGDGGIATVGDTLDLSAFAYTDNSYQWQESSTEDGTYSNLSGETGNTLDTTSHGTGFYKMLIDHPDLGQTFESKPIEVT